MDTERTFTSSFSESESVQVTVYLATSGYVQAAAVAVAAVFFFLAFMRGRRATWAILGSGTLLLFVGFLVSIVLYQLQPQRGPLLIAAPYINVLGWLVILVGAMTAFMMSKAPIPQSPSDEPSHSLEPAAGPDTDHRSKPPAK